MSAIVPAAEVSRAARDSFEWTTPTGKLLVINLDTRFVSVDGRPVHLTRKEYDILQLLCLRKGTTVTKQMFLNHLYGGMREPHLKIIDVFVCKLRKKLVELTGGKDYIETVWGRGYILRDPVPATDGTRHARNARSRQRPSRYDPTAAIPQQPRDCGALPELHHEWGRSLGDRQ